MECSQFVLLVDACEEASMLARNHSGLVHNYSNDKTLHRVMLVDASQSILFDFQSKYLYYSTTRTKVPKCRYFRLEQPWHLTKEDVT